MGSDLKPEILNEASNEIRHQYLSAQKARQMLNWTPHFNLDQGLALTIDWYKNFFAHEHKI
jgi:CDP-glucose 4,6-dehydratase